MFNFSLRKLGNYHSIFSYRTYLKHDHIQRMPEIEKWAQDIYNFVARKFPTVAL